MTLASGVAISQVTLPMRETKCSATCGSTSWAGSNQATKRGSPSSGARSRKRIYACMSCSSRRTALTIWCRRAPSMSAADCTSCSPWVQRHSTRYRNAQRSCWRQHAAFCSMSIKLRGMLTLGWVDAGTGTCSGAAPISRSAAPPCPAHVTASGAMSCVSKPRAASRHSIKFVTSSGAPAATVSTAARPAAFDAAEGAAEGAARFMLRSARARGSAARPAAAGRPWRAAGFPNWPRPEPANNPP
jgi:hypothetical protein